VKKRAALVLLVLIAATMACSRQAASQDAWDPASGGLKTPCPADGCSISSSPTAAWYIPATRAPDAPILTPTPDEPKVLPTLRTEAETYTIQEGDTLGIIASRNRVSLQDILDANKLTDPNLVSVGQSLIIPAPTPISALSSFKIIPDSELIYGPLSTTLALDTFVQQSGGYLAHYTESDDDATLTGSQIVQKVAQEYSINPRLLLALLEYRSGWVTQVQPDESTLNYPVGYFDERWQGLYKQLEWAANNLNRGYYLWRVNAAPVWFLADGSMVSVDNTINAGTAGVQNLFALLDTQTDWVRDVSEEGIYATFVQLFGYPFDLTVEPIVPEDVEQPELRLPFETGVAWSFTGGPHAAWGDGSAWAALDFAPPGDQLGCYQSDAWVVAMADGKIVRAENGEVMQDLDGDGLEQTGWDLLYMHIESRDRVKSGAVLKAGDRIGHPSCEGGVSNGTHTHLARKYNGEWIPADGISPFVLDGWISSGMDNEYDGYLTKNGKSIEAWNGRRPENQIEH
jgi:murein DD-endopeptidase MepM/ murein hydrolase activator NlpD